MAQQSSSPRVWRYADARGRTAEVQVGIGVVGVYTGRDVPHRLLKLATPCGGCGGSLAEVPARLFGQGSCRYCQGLVEIPLLERLRGLSWRSLVPWSERQTQFAAATTSAENASTLTVFDQLRMAMSDTRASYERGAVDLLGAVTSGVAGDEKDLFDASRQLGLGLLVKLVIGALGDEGVERDVEKSLMELLTEQLGGAPTDPVKTLGQLRAIAPDIDFRMLLRAFERLPSFRRHLAALISNSSRVVNLTVKFGRNTTAEQFERAGALHVQMQEAVERFSRLAPAHAEAVDPLLVQQLRSDGRWLRRQLSVVDAVSSSLINAPQVSLDDVLRELDELVGNEAVKQDVHGVLAVLRVGLERRRRGLPDADLRRHLAFSGNGGNGQGTVAALLGRIYAALGELERGHLTETSGRALVEGASLDDCLERARGGVLLVHGPSLLSDAASDTRGDSQEAWARLVEQVCADKGRRLLILSDTAKAMARLLAATPGLAGQLRQFEFEDYSVVELGRVLESMAKANHYRLSHEARLGILGCLDYVVTRDGALPGNAARLRELFEQAVSRQARRVAEAPGGSPAQLTLIQPGDFVFEMVPEEIGQRRPKFILVECQRCQARGRLPAKLLGCRVQCRACRHEMFADWGLPSPPHT